MNFGFIAGDNGGSTNVAPNKQIPNLASADEERDFWSTHNSTEFVDWSNATRVTLSSLKPATKTISIRSPESLLDELKLVANKWDVPYLSVLKVFPAERLDRELHPR